MRINFEQFTLFKDIAHNEKEILNVKNVLANEIYTKGQGIAFHALAFKIYNSEGEIELSDEEFAILIDFAEVCMSPNFIDSIKTICNGNESSI